MVSILIITAFLIPIKAISCELGAYNQGIVSNITFDRKQYKSVLSFESLIKSPDFNISEDEFPKPISEIIKIGMYVMNKVDIEQKWEPNSVALNKYNYNNCVYWYYQVNFSSGNYYAYLNVGLNGEPPDIYRIDETKLN